MAKIDNFNSQHVSNYLFGTEHSGIYSAWMHGASRILKESTVNTAKRVLGRQNYCFLGSYRNWIWEKDFQFVDDQGNIRPCRWRLFASTRGFSLEIEDKYDRPDGKFIRAAAVHGLYDFVSFWISNDDKFDHVRYNESKALWEDMKSKAVY